MAKKKYDLNSAIDEIWSGYESGVTPAADASNSPIDDIWDEYEKQPRRKILPPTKQSSLKQSVAEDPLAAFSEADRREMMRINTGAARNPVVRPTGKTADLEKRREAELRRNAELVRKNLVYTGPDKTKKSTDELNTLRSYSPSVTERLLGNLPKGQFRDKLIDAASVPENLLRGLDVGTKQMVADTANLGSLAERLVTGKDRSFWFDPIRDDFERMAQESMEAGNVLQGPLGNFARTSAVAVPQIATTLYAGQALTKAPMLAKVAARFPGLVKMLPFSLTAGGGYAREAQKAGANNWQQLGYGAAGGALEGLTEKYMFGNLEEVLAGGKKALQKALINIPFEAGQEAGIDPLTGLAKKAIYQHDMPWVGEGGVVDPQQMKDDAIAGAGTALLTGGTGLAVNSRARNKYLISKMHREVSDALLKNGAVESPTEAMILGGMMVEGAVNDAGGVNYNSLRQVAEINRELASKHPVGELKPETVDQINQVVDNMQQLGVPEEQVRQMVDTAVQNGLTAASENLTKPITETAETPQTDQETVRADEPAQPENRPNLAHFLGAAGLFSPIARPATQNTVQVATPAETVTEMPEAEVVTPQIDKTEKQTPVEEQSTDVAIPEVQSPTIVGPQETNYQVEQVVDKMGQEKGTTPPPSQVEMQTPIEVKTPVASEVTMVHETPEQSAEILDVQSKGGKRIVSFKYPNEEFKVEINPDGKYSVYYKNSKKPIEQYPKGVKKALDDLVNTISQPGVEKRTPVEEQPSEVTEATEKSQKADIPKKSQPVYNGLKTNPKEKMPDDSPRENNQGTPDAVRRHGDHSLEGKQTPDVPGTKEKRGTVRDGLPRPGTGEGSPDADDAGARSGLRSGEGDRNRNLHSQLDSKPKSKEKRNPNNFRIQSEADMGVTETGKKTRYRQNVAAIRLLKQLEAEGRKATLEEQQVLAKYVGWGGIKDVFEYYLRDWQTEREELRGLLTPEEYAAANASKLNAHYTSKTVIDSMYQALQHLGFKGGRVLEPSLGVGNFFGLMPKELAAGSRLTGVELDSISGRIAQQLYPDSDIRVQGFEKLNVPDHFYDVAISNVPFGDYPVVDLKYPKLITQRIHNYFFAKAIDKVRPGGLIMFITSTGTLDAKDPVAKAVRQYLSERAELVGAIRFPNTAFKSNSGTEVTTDLIILQKKGAGVKERATKWQDVVKVLAGSQQATVNEYFANHPEMVLGEHAMTGSMYRSDSYTVNPTGDLAEQLAAALKKLPKNILVKPVHQATEGVKPSQLIPPDATFNDTREGKVFIRDGQAMKIENQVAITLNVKELDLVKQYLEIEKITRELFRRQLQNVPDTALTKLQKELNAAYDAFVKKHGKLHTPKVSQIFGDDPDYPLIMAIEDYDSKTKIAKKGAIFSKRVRRPYVKPTSAQTAQEALAIALNEHGGINLERMVELTGKTAETLLDELAGLVFENPEGGLETADQYLSGNVREKLTAAEGAARLDPKYQANVDALKAVQPEDLKPGDISFSLGQPWIPPEVYSDFVAYLFARKGIEVQFMPQTGEWLLNGTTSNWKSIAGSVENNSKWGTGRVEALKLIEMALNQKKPTVYDAVDDDKKVVNRKETAVAREKQDNIKEEFRKWVISDAVRAQALTDKYNWEYNNIRLRTYDGSHLQFPGMNPAKNMRPHQKNAIWRYLQGGNCLFAHCVGAGKTFEMVASVMEARRLGILQKPVIVVPKSRLRGTAEDALELYPGAKVLVADDKNFSKDKRKQFMAKIATGDYDVIIMSHNNFQTITLSEEAAKEFFQKQLDELETARIAEADADKRSKRGFGSNLEKAKKRLTAKMNETVEKLKRRQDTGNVSFEELGIDGILVDEAHYYKNLFYGTSQRVAGLGSTAGNDMTFDLLMKIQYLRRLNGGRGVAFATGTPVANSMAELYSLQRYLQPDELEKRSLHNFDMWASVFGKIVSVLEMSPEGGGFRVKEKFAQFSNLPELVQMFRSFADVQTADMLNLPVPKLAGGKRQTVIAKPSPEFTDFLNNELLPRAEAYRKNPAAAKPEEMLEITRLGRLAALDMRLIKPGLADDPNSKVNQSVANIFEIWKESKKDRLTQAVFLDLSTPKRDQEENGVAEDEAAGGAAESTFNLSVYQDIKQKLIKQGVPADEIAFVHDAKTDTQKQKLFERVNQGEIRVVIGSTNKMGVGVNMQDRLVALHHLDCPWRPVDIEQREGRILRQGNQNKEVQILNYVTEGSFDAFMWDKVQQKAQFIHQIMAGKISGRNAEDVGDMVLNAAEIAACASGNPLHRERATLSARFRTLEDLRSSHQNEQYNLKLNRGRIPAKLTKLQETIAAIGQDLKNRRDISGDKFVAKIDNQTFTKRDEADAALLKIIHTEAEADKVVGKMAGFELRTTTLSKSHAAADPLAKQDLIISGEYSYYPATMTIRGVENKIKGIDEVLTNFQQELAEVKRTQAAIDAEINKPFDHEDEYQKVAARLEEIDAELNLDGQEEQDVIADPEAGSVAADTGGKARVGSYADTGGYADIEPEGRPKTSSKTSPKTGSTRQTTADVNPLAIELPELLELAQQINEGKLPLLREKLGKALGKFSFQDGQGQIKLRRDIFLGERLAEVELNFRKDIKTQIDAFTKQVYEKYGEADIVFRRESGTTYIAYRRDHDLVTKVLAHEIGHLVDWLPEKQLSRGNLLGRIASLKKYMKRLLPESPGAPGVLTERERRRLRYQAEQLVEKEKQAAGVPEEPVGPTAEEVLGIWNDVKSREKNPGLYDYISRLSGAEKAQILKQAMKGMAKLPGFDPKKHSNYKDWSDRQKQLYRELVSREIKKRRLFELENIQNELKALTQLWKPFDEQRNPKYTKYRYSPAELYADAFSVLINNPGLLKQKAPNFYRAFFNYLKNKPQVKAIYDEIQQRIGDSAQKLNHRLDQTYRNFTEGHVRRNELNQRRRLKAKTVVDTLLAGLVDRNQGTLKLVRQYEKGEEQEAALARQARWQLEETSYISAEADHYMYELGQQVLKPLEAAGLTVDDLGVYLFHQRVIYERADLANPEGYGAKTSTDMLEAIKQRLGDEAFKKLEQLAKDYRKLREEQIISRVSDSRMFSQDTVKMMQERKHYAKFSVQHYLEKSYGTGTTARIMKQVGTINKIENPLVVTVLNDLTMLRAAKINEAKLAVVAFLQEIGDAKTGAVITPARTRRNPVTQRQEAVTPQDPSLALLDVMVDGEVHSFYVAKEIAESFEYRPFEATRVAEIWGLVMGPLKAMLVSKNPIWIARNFIRDLRTTYKNIPELKGKQLWKFLKYYGQSFGEVKQAVFKGERSTDLSAMYQNFMINPNRQYAARERNFENDLERLADEFQLGLYDEREAKGAKGRLKAFVKWLDRWGQVSEQTSKLAGYKFLTNETKRSAAEIGHVVRTRIGTPDVRRVGKWQQVTNNLFIFSTVNKEGWRSMAESYQENPGTYIWKTIWANFLPKLILVGLGAGIARGLGDDDDWWKQLIDAIPDYDKRSYNILPLGLTPDGKAVYFRLPEDYEGQIFGVLAYTLFKGRILGKDGLLAQAAEQLPYDWDNPNPYFGIAHDLWQYYINQQNPVDEYRGRNVLPRKVFEAGGWEANQRMLGYAWQNLGGSALYTPATDLDENAVQKLMKWPGLNILGSFLKISDRGTYEDYYEEKDHETQAKARKALDIEKRVKADVKKIHGTPTIDDAENLYDRLVNAGILSEEECFGRFFSQRYLGYAGKAVADSRLGMILKARSKADRAKLLYKAKKELAPKAYEALKEKLAGLDLWADEIMEEE